MKTKLKQAIKKYGKRNVDLVIRYNGDYMKHENCQGLYSYLTNKTYVVPFNKFAAIADFLNIRPWNITTGKRLPQNKYNMEGK